MATPRYHYVVSWWAARELGLPGFWDQIYHEKMLTLSGILRSGDGMMLAQTLRNSNTGKVSCFLINGDQGDTRTERRQQWVTRRVLQSLDTPCLIVPFRALATAGIDPLSIRPIEITGDRMEAVVMHAPGYNEDEIVWSGNQNDSFAIGRIPGRSNLYFVRRQVTWKWEDQIQVQRLLPPEEQEIKVTLNNFPAKVQPDGTLLATRTIHRLGDSVFSACLRDESKRRKFISSFDYQERWPLYFLAELPAKSRVKTVEDAILALAPPIVHAAIAQQRDVKRQGDMFAIPTELTTTEVKLLTGGTIRRMRGIFGTDHIVTESYVGRNRVTYGRGVIHHRPAGRQPDHRSVRLDKVWHLMVPNTVPRRRRGATAQVEAQTPNQAPTF